MDTTTPKQTLFKSTTVNEGGSDDKYFPLPRQGHASALFGDTLFVFGGRTKGENRTRKYLNDTWIYSFEESMWEKVEHQGDPISERWNHTAVLHDDNVWIFGGQTNGDKYCGDLYCFNLTKRHWRKVTPQGKTPSARHGHECIVYLNYMVLFGGRDGYRPEHFANDFWVFDFQTESWNSIEIANSPSGRYYHNLVLHNHTTLYMFGGYTWDGHEHYYNDLYSLYLPHVLESRDGNSLQNDKISWNSEKSSGDSPRPRNRVGLASLDNLLVIHGGNNFDGHKDSFFDDIHVFHTESKTWDKATLTKDEPARARGHHTCHVRGNVIIFFGGEHSRKRFNDIWHFQLVDGGCFPLHHGW